MKHLVNQSDLRNTQWQIWKHDYGYSHDQVLLSVLMDVREELRRLNTTLHCQNFLEIPHRLNQIVLNTKKKRRIPHERRK